MLKLALIGYGNVGRALARLLQQNGELAHEAVNRAEVAVLPAKKIAQRLEHAHPDRAEPDEDDVTGHAGDPLAA